jgi:homoserine O-succinyltransferase
MPLVHHIPLPTFDRLRAKGQEVLSLEQAVRQDIRELHIGFLNMMPDAALQVTEEQFMRLVGNSNQIAQFYVHPFSVPGLPRSAETQEYIDNFYTTFEQLQMDGLDALIITGANVANPSLDQEPFWEPLMRAIGWAARTLKRRHQSLGTRLEYLCVRRIAIPTFAHQRHTAILRDHEF